MNKQTLWEKDEFEEHIIGIQCATLDRSKAKRDQGVKPKDYRFYKNNIPYMPDNTRLAEIYIDTTDPYKIIPQRFDFQNDALPERGIFTQYCSSSKLGVEAVKTPDWAGGHKNVNTRLIYFRRIKQLPKEHYVYGHGKTAAIFEIIVLNCSPTERPTAGKRYFSINENGLINGCYQEMTGSVIESFNSKTLSTITHEPWIMTEAAAMGAAGLQYTADKRFCWRIRANEDGLKVDLGCQQEEIKSLLYARNLPMTETGRKRPLLHLIESHKRRIKSGTDIDVSAHLKGLQDVVIGNTSFKILPPKVIQNDLSKNSGRFYMNTGQQP